MLANLADFGPILMRRSRLLASFVPWKLAERQIVVRFVEREGSVVVYQDLVDGSCER